MHQCSSISSPVEWLGGEPTVYQRVRGCADVGTQFTKKQGASWSFWAHPAVSVSSSSEPTTGESLPEKLLPRPTRVHLWWRYRGRWL